MNFAPRIRQPVLLVDGRDDFIFPLDTTQRPLLALLGSRPDERRLPRSKDLIRESLDCFDRHLGPVAQ